MFSWGDDFSIIDSNLKLRSISNPLQISNFHDLKSYYISKGLAVDKVSSGEISAILEETSSFEPGKSHDALSDAISIASSLNKLTKKFGHADIIKMLSH